MTTSATPATDPAAEPLSIIGRDAYLIENVAKLLAAAASKRHNYTGLRQLRRGFEFDLQLLVDDKPTGHIAKVTVVLDHIDPSLVK